ncbi:MAG: hypothetical protein H6622_10825 [Halobacteriovoraceae bacterium]|nr:hypothetical protein [Halobacteriovoraceae bacterium]
MFKYTIIFYFLFLSSLSARVLEYKISGLKEKKFELKQVCKSQKLPTGPIVTTEGIQKVDCMGEIVDVNKFCEKNSKGDPDFLRGIADSSDGIVVCQNAKMAVLTIICDERDGHLCQSPKSSCQNLKSKFARGHKLYHSSLVGTNKNGKLKCYFTSDSEFKNEKNVERVSL